MDLLLGFLCKYKQYILVYVHASTQCSLCINTIITEIFIIIGNILKYYFLVFKRLSCFYNVGIVMGGIEMGGKL
jgi:hypothetical protein